MQFHLPTTAFATLLALPAAVYGHGYMNVPLSRNIYAYHHSISGNPIDVVGVPLYQTTPQAMNRNTGVCGKDQDAPGIDYDEWIDTQGNPMPSISQATYGVGDIIEITTVLTAHHKGHIEVKACPMGRASTQECFDQYPLEFVSDLLYGMPKDDNYPGRGHLHGLKMDLNMQFKLPDDDTLTGSEVLLQWVYWTANSCNSLGYEDYFAGNYGAVPESPGEPNWASGLDDCPPESATPLAPLPNPELVGTLFPEVFINCAEVTITSEGGTTVPASNPTNLPSSSPVAGSTGSPTLMLVPEATTPTASPTVDINLYDGTCGDGWPGNGICSDKTLCCSEWGYCGTTDEHCGETSAPISTCGGGQRGNGLCPEAQCCSEWGYCGTGSDYCESNANTNAPTSSSAPTLAPVPIVVPAPNSSHSDIDSRMIAYLGNWHACPTDDQLAEYTHIVIAFAVSYTWSPDKNVCDPTCKISKPLTCDNREDEALIERWQAMGKKVILSFGGAGMGGSWDGDNNDCWDFCFGNEDYVVDRLTDLVTEMGLDGIDIDYEYYYENGQNGSTFNKGAEAQKFLKDVTLGLRDALPETAELTHAPMEPDMVPGKAYFDVLVEVADSLDFLMPQYYNGNVYSHSNFDVALNHYNNIVNTMFHGDPTKVVFGFCINDCSNFNLDGSASKEVMGWLAEDYPCNGGAFFWVVNDDTNGDWSSKVNEQLAIDTDQCSTGAPTSMPTGAPTSAPALLVLEDTCVNDANFRYEGKSKKDCDWVLKKANSGNDVCDKTSEGILVAEACPLSCGTCCADDAHFRFDGGADEDCGWVRREHLGGASVCNEKHKRKILVKDFCRSACQTCCVDDEAFRWNHDDDKDCDWVQKQHAKGKNTCRKRDAAGIRIKKFCPVACETCTSE